MTNLHGNMAGNGAGHTARRTPHRAYAACPALPCCPQSPRAARGSPIPAPDGRHVLPRHVARGRLYARREAAFPPFPSSRRVADRFTHDYYRSNA